MAEITCPIQEAAEKWPDASALVAPHKTYTFREYNDHVSRAAENLTRAGIAEGDIVALGLPNCLQYPIILMALFRLGAIACPLNTRLPVNALLRQLRNLNCADVIVPYGASVTAEAGDLHALSPRDLVDDRPPSSPGNVAIDAEQPATVIYTSGSSSEPKPALHAYANHYENARASNANFLVEPGHRWLLSLPLYHVAGMGILFRCALGGAAVVIAEAKLSIPQAVEAYAVTHLSLVSTQLYRLLHGGDAKVLEGLKGILLGGSAIPEPLLRKAAHAKLPIYTSYGLTEMATQVTTTAKGDPLDKLLTSGRPIVPDSIRIAGDDEILVNGPTRFLGYITEGKIDLPLDDEGWFHTGDLGRIIDEGYLIVSGRIDNMFISGGENIQPEEIEDRLTGIPGIEEACVVPVDHPEFGQVPAAFVKTKDDTSIDEQAIRAELAAHLPPFKIPKAILPWPPELDEDSMKVARRRLQEHAEELGI